MEALDDLGVDDYLKQCVSIVPEAIQEEFMRIPAMLAYWNARYAQAIREHLNAKLDEKILRANLLPVIRTELMEAGAKLTESQVEAALDSNESLIEAQRRTIDADAAKAEAYGQLDAIRSKKEMLISLGAQLRAELQGDPLIRETVRGAREFKR